MSTASPGVVEPITAHCGANPGDYRSSGRHGSSEELRGVTHQTTSLLGLKIELRD